jgi:HEAT repeat protein
MDNTLQNILTLIDKGTIEQRCAALLVLGALKINNAATSKLIGTILDSPNPVLKDYALRYFEEVQPKSNTAQLLKMLDDGDRDIQERAVKSLIGVGQAAVQPLLQGAKDASRNLAVKLSAGARRGARQGGAEGLAAIAYRRHRRDQQSHL